jgi:Zn-dependent M28 family amino/carboxypeptidase
VSPAAPFLATALAALLIAGAAGAETDFTPLRPTAAALRDKALADPRAYEITEALTTEIGARPAGSPAMLAASDWAVARLNALGFDKVWVEPFTVTAWTRGVETASVVAPYPHPLSIVGLGGSVPTPPGGIDAEIAVFATYEALLAQPAGSLAGKMVVLNQVMPRTQGPDGYFSANRIRSGASEAARRGAAAYLVRSLSTGSSRAPHTGSQRYVEGLPRIPTAALSTPDADLLARMAARGAPVRVKLSLASTVREAAETRTVVAELTGREKPDEIVLIGAHLDSWDLGTGAVDDAAGVAEVTAAAKLIAELPRRPRRTVRIALFGAEEIGGSAAAYAARHGAAEQAKHVLASEADSGADRVYYAELPAGAAASPFGRAFAELVSPLGVVVSATPATDGGADLSRLQGVPLAMLQQDLTTYFDLHHSADDTFDKVDRARLSQATAAWAVLTYLAAESDVDFRATQPPRP